MGGGSNVDEGIGAAVPHPEATAASNTTKTVNNAAMPGILHISRLRGSHRILSGYNAAAIIILLHGVFLDRRRRGKCGTC